MKELEITYVPEYKESNINYAFQRLIFSLTAATLFEPYNDSFNEFKEVLEVVKKWLSDYLNNGALNMDPNELLEIKNKLFELDNKYLSEPGLYAEDAYEWIIQLEILYEKRSD